MRMIVEISYEEGYDTDFMLGLIEEVISSRLDSTKVKVTHAINAPDDVDTYLCPLCKADV